MERIKLIDMLNNEYTQKHLLRAGLYHSIKVAEHAYDLAIERNVNVDIAVKAAFLHDVGHYYWYTEGKWDIEKYKENDIHAIKGAERAHKLLIKLGEERSVAKEISVAILLHTDSYLPESVIKRTPLQEVVKLADEMDEESDGSHHNRKISWEEAVEKVIELDKKIENAILKK